jgi:acylphosphatase
VPNVDADTETAITNMKILNLLVDLRAEAKQLILSGVVSSFLDNLKDSDSKVLINMQIANKEKFANWCEKHKYAGVDDEWDNDLLFIKEVVKYAESKLI